jgi:hypothetical protein
MARKGDIASVNEVRILRAVAAKQMVWSRSEQGHGRPSSKRFKRLCMTPSIAASSGSKARMFEHRDVRPNRQGLLI